VFRRSLSAPGVAIEPAPLDLSAIVAGLPGYQLFDSLAVDGEGNVCVATLINGGISVINPADGGVTHVATDDLLTTNICFGDRDGSGEYRDAYITCSGTGRLLHMRWPHKGLRLNYV
jgi:gluconolactonase